MGLVGAGYGAAKTLEDLVAEQLLRKKLAAEIQNQEASLAERQRSSMADESARNRQLDIQDRSVTEAADSRAADRRQRSNEMGLRSMGADFIRQQQGPMTPDAMRGLAAIQAEAGDRIDPDLLNPPVAPQKKYTSPLKLKGGIIQQFPEGEIPPGTQYADEGPKPEKMGVHVIDGKLVDDTGKVVYEGSTKPPVSGSYTAERARRTIGDATALIGKVSPWTTGFGGLLKDIPTADAKSFAQDMKTLKANITFNELAEMREASKTGGALGQVSDKEGELLGNALAALDPLQKPAQVKAALEKTIESVKRWNEVKNAPSTPVPSHGGSDFIDMVHPDGRSLRVPAADVEKALAAGARRK